MTVDEAQVLDIAVGGLPSFNETVQPGHVLSDAIYAKLASQCLGNAPPQWRKELAQTFRKASTRMLVESIAYTYSRAAQPVESGRILKP